MIAQLSLPIPSRRRHYDYDLNRLINRLDWGSDWFTARELCADLDMSDRQIRKLAEMSEGRIIGTDHGYKLTSRVTPEEFSEWRGRYESQIKRMLERVQRTARQWHKRTFDNR